MTDRTLTVQWNTYAGGPAVDVTAQTITITNISTGVVAIGPTSVGITHPATGLYAYVWAIPTGQAVGSYLIVWNATDSELEAVVASEVITVDATVTPTPTRGPCEPWTPTWCCNLTAASIPLTGAAVQAATEILYNRSGQQFGVCTFTIRPCRENCYDDVFWGSGAGGWFGGWSYPQPALIGGSWYNLTCGGCGGSCSCTPLSVALMPSPVAAIVEVKLNGEVLAASGYRVDNFRKLVRLGGESWPVCQDLTLADTEPDTWSVTLQVGQEPPAIAGLAVGELACEIMKSCLGEACAIPRNATTVTRQGITIDFPSLYELLDRKLLGLYAADLFVSTYNPKGLAAPPQVYDVDGESWRRTT